MATKKFCDICGEEIKRPILNHIAIDRDRAMTLQVSLCYTDEVGDPCGSIPDGDICPSCVSKTISTMYPVKGDL